MNPYTHTQQQKGYYGVMLKNLGYYKNADDVLNSPGVNSALNSGYLTAGDIKYADMNGNGMIDSGEQQVIQKQLQRTAQAIDTDAATCALEFKVPTNISETEKNGVSLSNIVVAVEISTAAVMTPVEDSPKLGVPADWTSPHKYAVNKAYPDL